MTGFEGSDDFVWEEPDQAELRELAIRAQERSERRAEETSRYVDDTMREIEVDPPSEDSVIDALAAEEEADDEDWDELENIASGVAKIAMGLGVRRARLTDAEVIQKLDNEFWFDIPLRDRILELWDDELGILYPPTIEDLEDDENATPDMIFRKTHQKTVEAADFLGKSGIDRFEMLEWGMTGSEQQKHAMRCLAWVLKRPFMNEFVNDLHQRAEQLGEPFSFKSVIQELTQDKAGEITKRFDDFYIRQMASGRTADKLSVPTEPPNHVTFDPIRETWTKRTQKAYEIVERELKVTLAVCKQVFVPYLLEGVYDRHQERL